MKKIKIFTPPRYKGADVHPILYNADEIDNRAPGLRERVEKFKYDNLEIVTAPEECDLILLPNAFIRIDDSIRNYVDCTYKEYKKYDKPFIISIFGDHGHKDHFSFGIVLKSSAYKKGLKSNEIVVPAYAEDFGSSYIPSNPDSLIPTVTFCGYSSLKNIYRWIILYVKIILNTFTPEFRRGIYYRKKLMEIFKKRRDIKTNFIKRKSFSAMASDRSEYRDKIRKEFVENVISGQYVIAPKGDANYSNRFYESLSVGRIPIVPDTDIVLPLENIIDYSNYVIRVPMNSLDQAPILVIDHFRKNIKNWRQLEEDSIQFYQKYLRFDSCVQIILERIINNDKKIFAKP